MVEISDPDPVGVDPYTRALELIYLHESGEHRGALARKPGVALVNMVSHSRSEGVADTLVRCDACGDEQRWLTDSGREARLAKRWCEDHRRMCPVLAALTDVLRKPQCIAPGCTAKRTGALYCVQDDLLAIAPAAVAKVETAVGGSAARVLNRIVEGLRLSGQDDGANAVERLLRAVGDADDAERAREYIVYCTTPAAMFLAPADAPAVAEALQWALRQSGHVPPG